MGRFTMLRAKSFLRLVQSPGGESGRSLPHGRGTHHAGLQAAREVRHPHRRPGISRWSAWRAGEARGGERLQVHRLSLYLDRDLRLSEGGGGEDRRAGSEGVFSRKGRRGDGSDLLLLL